MSTTVSYKGNTIATVNNNTKTLETEGKYLEADIVLTDVSQSAPVLQTKFKTYTPSGSQQTEQVTADNGYDGLQEVDVTVNPIPSEYIIPSGTKQITQNGTGIDVKAYEDVDVAVPNSYAAGDEGKVVSNGALVAQTSQNIGTNGTYDTTLKNEVVVDVPTGTARTGSDVGVTDDTVTIPAGLYGSQVVKQVAAGTEGTPSASKGSVSNHAVQVTPSVTNTKGFIQGGTHSGTPVSVSASELVSGTLNVDSAGTKDVTNYQNASIPSGTEGTPVATKGSVSNHSVQVTPSVQNGAGFVAGGTHSGTPVTVSASELVSGSQTVQQNGTVDVTNLAEIVVDVQGGSAGMAVGTATATPASASSSISFTGLQGEPTSFYVVSAANLATGASPYKTAAVVFDGTNLIGQYISNTSNAQMTYSSTGWSKSYSNGTLTITGTGSNWQANEYKLVYTYGGTSANLGTEQVQVGSGATSITFTGLTEEPTCWSCIFTSNIGTSSGYTRAHIVVFDGSSIYGMEMGSGSSATTNWTKSYSNGSLTITSTSTSAGGYFHQPGYYELAYGIGGEINIEIEPLSVTQNGTYSESGKAYSPVVVNVSGSGSASIGTKTTTNSSASNTSISFTQLSGTPKAFFVRLTTQVARNSSNRYYYIATMSWDGSSSGGVAGNKFYQYNGTFSNQTTGYSYTYSNGTLTLSSTGSQSSSPGSFFNGDYELIYVY